MSENTISMVDIFLKLVDEIKFDIDSINTQSISKQDFEKKALTIKQKIIYLKNTKITEREKQIYENSLMFVMELFKRKISEFKYVETNIKNKKRQQNERIIKGLSPTISDKDLEEALKNPTNFTKLKILSNDPDEIIIGKLKNATEKYNDLLQLESNIAELNQMFLDFALIIDKQCDLLDKIELGVKFTDEYINDGNNQLCDAIKEQRKYKIRQMCLYFIFFVVIIVIGLIIYFILKT